MKWFRFYDEVLDDPKCQRLTPVMFRHWVNILCIANRSNQRGTLPAVEHIAFSLRLTEAKTTAVLNDLVIAGLLDRNGNETFSPHGWSSRQRVSDDVAQRVSKHRERNESEPLPKQKSNVTDTLPHVRATEAETDTEAETENPPQPPEGEGVRPEPTMHEQRFESFWLAYPKKTGKESARKWWLAQKPSGALHTKMLTAIGAQKVSLQWLREDGRFIPNPATWLNQGRWDDEEPDVPRNALTVHAGGRAESPNGYRTNPGPKGWSADELAAQAIEYERKGM